MLRKTMVVAMAVGVLGAVGVPGVAVGSWQHNHQALQQNVQLGLTGNFRMQSGLGGFECQVTSRVQFSPGTTGVVETFVPHPTSETANCKGLGGLAFCQIHNLTPQAPNWTMHTDASQTPQGTKETHQNAAVITTTTIHSQATGGFCPVTTISFTVGKLGMIPEPTSSTTISSIQIHGPLQVHLTTTNSTVDSEQVFFSGTFQIEDLAQRNTYGF